MNTEGLRNLACIIFIAIGAPAILYLSFKYVLPILIPFLIAWTLALIVRRPAERISGLIGIRERIVRPIMTGLFVSVIFLFAGLFIFGVSHEVWQIITEFGEGEKFRGFIDGFLVSGGILENLVGQFGEGLSDALFKAATSLLSGLFGILTSFASALPGVILAIVITVISAIYFSVDLERINRAIISLFPKNMRDNILKVKNGFLSVGIRYVWSYFLLFLITFFTVLAGFVILRVPYALFLSVLLAFFDLLPVVGVGTVLLPYGIFEIATGNVTLGVGILVLFAVQTVIRELAEPKILGKNLGVHPLLTLVVLYSGYTLFGFVGILCVPLFTVALKLILTKKNTADIDGDIGGE